MEASANAFRKTGLIPCNRHIFRDHEFSIHQADSQHQGAGETENEDPIPGPSSDSNIGSLQSVSPRDIRPIPQLRKQDSASAGRPRTGSAAHITSSPYRKQLQVSKEKKAALETKKAEAAKKLFGENPPKRCEETKKGIHIK
ncbi:hypothetical protein ANN_20600 [Periplaneta americana]|uniref:Uncharacterized protein n=1 Tax=Periplaneta americana TaxID=6978 RepID=A0ABQ8SE71_PERAM|nr:hypothetical protein ANN_20600 [Periplaneta americana]